MVLKNGLEIAQIPQRVWQPRPIWGCRNRVRGNSRGWCLFILLLFILCSLMKYLLWAFSMPATVLCTWDVEMNQQFNWAPQDILQVRLGTWRYMIITQYKEDKHQDSTKPQGIQRRVYFTEMKGVKESFSEERIFELNLDDGIRFPQVEERHDRREKYIQRSRDRTPHKMLGNKNNSEQLPSFLPPLYH